LCLAWQPLMLRGLFAVVERERASQARRQRIGPPSDRPADPVGLAIANFAGQEVSPWENGYAESCNSPFRDEMRACEEFENVAAARPLDRITTTTGRTVRWGRPE
jgi:hypothetical protein